MRDLQGQLHDHGMAAKILPNRRVRGAGEREVLRCFLCGQRLGVRRALERGEHRLFRKGLCLHQLLARGRFGRSLNRSG